MSATSPEAPSLTTEREISKCLGLIEARMDVKGFLRWVVWAR
jgi:hypothetical protein